MNNRDIGGWTVQEGSAPYRGCMQRIRDRNLQCSTYQSGSGQIYNDGTIGSGSSPPIVREFAVVTNISYQGSPAVSGNMVVWTDERHGNEDIYGKDLATGREFAVTTNPAQQGEPAISGNIVVWEDGRNGGLDIYGKNLSTGTEFPVAVSGYAAAESPAISNEIAVWVDDRNGPSCIGPYFLSCDIFGKNLTTGEELEITVNLAPQLDPAISGNVVVWRDCRNGWQWPLCRYNQWDIYGKNLTTGREFAVVTNTAAQYRPAISGNIVVWEDERNGNYDVYGKDLASGVEFAVVTNTAGQWWPAISGNIVVWTDYRNGNYDIYGKNLATGREFAVVTNTAAQYGPAIMGNIVVWEDGRNGNLDIYGARLEWPSPTPTPTPTRTPTPTPTRTPTPTPTRTPTPCAPTPVGNSVSACTAYIGPATPWPGSLSHPDSKGATGGW